MLRGVNIFQQWTWQHCDVIWWQYLVWIAQFLHDVFVKKHKSFCKELRRGYEMSFVSQSCLYYIHVLLCKLCHRAKEIVN